MKTPPAAPIPCNAPGAGWGPWSNPSSAVTTRAVVIVITGRRVDRRTVAVTGVTSGLSGSMVVPWLR